MLTWLKSKLKTERIVPGVMVVYLAKGLYHRLLPRPEAQKLLLIVGCQRSGTSLMNRIFSRDWQVSVYREASQLSSNDLPKRLRLNPLPQVQQELHRNKAPILVLKPLVESQNILQLFEFFPHSQALWMYRHYRDTAISLVSRFGPETSLRDLKAIVEGDRTTWHAEGVSEAVRAIVTPYYSDDMSPYDAAALFWFARNSLFYERHLDQNPRVWMVRYEDLVTQPGSTIESIYHFLGHNPPDTQTLVQEVTATSVGRGKTVELLPAIDERCAALLTRLDQSCAAQAAMATPLRYSLSNVPNG